MVANCRLFSIFLMISLFAFSISVPLFVSPILEQDSPKFGEFHQNFAGRFKRSRLRTFVNTASSYALVGAYVGGLTWVTKKAIEKASGRKMEKGYFDNFPYPYPESVAKKEDGEKRRVTIRFNKPGQKGRGNDVGDGKN